ncbi:GrpB family protein [Paraburkholderia caribensis]|uniref:GrpB family protein n=1 Tax=Paraburkholderia caribensis TaxID=75105 RepID=UPI001591C23C|nr:GrpB family protein [Paraburkholderia caribensis]
MESKDISNKFSSDRKAPLEIGVVSISEYRASWADQFLKEASCIRSATNCAQIYIDHVGSTAVEGLPAKPIIDILISISDWSAAESLVSELEGLGYKIGEKCDKVPRYFLKKYSAGGSEGFHIHVCEPHRRWGREMLTFKEELKANYQFARAYADLKKQLANKYRENLQAYMVGKKDFIENKLREIRSEFSVNKLLTHQRAELNKAERLQVQMIGTQFAIATTAAISVYSNDNKYLFGAAILTFILMVFWLSFSQGQQRHRSAGDQVRRVILLISGLDMEPSAGQKLRIIDSFEVSTLQIPLRREEDHFATREEPGYKRLSEMIEESSYWTRDLQHASARVMFVILVILVAILFITAGTAVVSLKTDNLISLARAMIAIMVFAISSDFLGLFLAYRNSAIAIDEIFRRVEAVDARGYMESDILVLMSDYNAAIERSPAPFPWVYRFRQNELSQRWRAYMEAKLVSQSSQSSGNESS